MILWHSRRLVLNAEPVSIMVPAGELVAVGRRTYSTDPVVLNRILKHGRLILRARRKEVLNVQLEALPKAGTSGWLAGNLSGVAILMDDEADATVWTHAEDVAVGEPVLTLWLAYASVAQEPSAAAEGFTG